MPIKLTKLLSVLLCLLTAAHSATLCAAETTQKITTSGAEKKLPSPLVTTAPTTATPPTKNSITPSANTPEASSKSAKQATTPNKATLKPAKTNKPIVKTPLTPNSTTTTKSTPKPTGTTTINTTTRAPITKITPPQTQKAPASQAPLPLIKQLPVAPPTTTKKLQATVSEQPATTTVTPAQPPIAPPTTVTTEQNPQPQAETPAAAAIPTSPTAPPAAMLLPTTTMTPAQARHAVQATIPTAVILPKKAPVAAVSTPIDPAMPASTVTQEAASSVPATTAQPPAATPDNTSAKTPPTTPVNTSSIPPAATVSAAPGSTTIDGQNVKRDPQDPVQFVASFYIALDQAESFTSVGRMAKLQDFFDSELAPLLLKDDEIRDANEEPIVCGFMNFDAFDLNRKNRTTLNHYELIPKEFPPLVSVAFLDNEGAAVWIRVVPEKGLLKIHDMYYDDPDSKIGRRKSLLDILRKAQSQHCVKSPPETSKPSAEGGEAAPAEKPEAE